VTRCKFFVVDVLRMKCYTCAKMVPGVTRLWTALFMCTISPRHSALCHV